MARVNPRQSISVRPAHAAELLLNQFKEVGLILSLEPDTQDIDPGRQSIRHRNGLVNLIPGLVKLIVHNGLSMNLM